jgi:L-fucose isomerase-like protein
LGARAKAIPDQAADDTWQHWQLPVAETVGSPLRSAVKLYLAVKQDLAEDPGIRAVGINCLNESHFSDTTPCLAWNMLFQEGQYVWGCEADSMSMLTQYILYRSLGVPILMTNLYPFLLGQAALKHERIADFPPVEQPEHHVLVAHCGYFGLLPQAFATTWNLRKKVLGIVDDNATVIDARLPTGAVTLAKLHPTMREMTVAEGQLTGYVQYPGSDCRNGGIIRVRDGRRFMDRLCSHHYLLTTGHNLTDIRLLAQVFDLQVEEL